MNKTVELELSVQLLQTLAALRKKADRIETYKAQWTINCEKLELAIRDARQSII